MRLALVLLALAGCGDSLAVPVAISAGPVAIDTRTLTLTIGPFGVEHFLAIGEATKIDATHYYDPAAPESAILFERPTRAIGLTHDGWLVLDDTSRIRLTLADANGGVAAGS
jgi:hypothetical protein